MLGLANVVGAIGGLVSVEIFDKPDHDFVDMHVGHSNACIDIQVSELGSFCKDLRCDLGPFSGFFIEVSLWWTYCERKKIKLGIVRIWITGNDER